MKHFKRILFSLGIMLLLGSKLNAQIQGELTDLKGLAVTNAIITATDSVSKTTDTAKVDKRGFYEFKGLKPGIYTIEAKAPGFRPAIRKGINITKDDNGAIKGEEDMYRGHRLDFVMTKQQ